MDIIKVLTELLPVLLPVLLECFDNMTDSGKAAFVRYLSTPGNALKLTNVGLAIYGTTEDGAALDPEVATLIDMINAELAKG